MALFHGDVGTGKSFYLKHLLMLSSKKVIYVPSSLVARMAEPDFLKFVIEQTSDCIYICEDSEEILKSREDSSNCGAVANLLNASDGILGSALKSKFIATFNTSFDSLDKALLRKGRLCLTHKFEALSVDQSNKLLNHLRKNHITDKPMTLAEIYNLEVDNLVREQSKERIGFCK